VDFAHSARTSALQAQVQQFLDDLVLPAQAQWQRYVAAGVYPVDVLGPLKQQAQSLRLWNLFLPQLRADEPGQRLDNLEYAPLAEIMGRVPWSAEVFNCSAPDTGNIELLHRHATPAQAARWLAPLLAGEMRSCFAMSEPDVASSDPTNIATRIERNVPAMQQQAIDGHCELLLRHVRPRNWPAPKAGLVPPVSICSVGCHHAPKIG
jgi:acyl-CoA dehydrogenase